MATKPTVTLDLDNYRAPGSHVHDLFSLKNKTVVITGGARGLGLSFARACAEVGANIAALDLLPNPHADFALLSSELGAKAKCYQVDVCDASALETVFQQVRADFGTVDCCVTAAGIGMDKPFLDTTPADVAKLLQVNVAGTYLTLQAAAKIMIAQGTGGSLLTVASVGAHIATPGKSISAYCATKGGVLSMTRAVADELIPYNIRCNSISPGYILTDMTIRNIDTRPNVIKEIEANIPSGKLGDRRDLKGAVVLLLSDASAYTTGTDLCIDGGLVAH
jgi:NAD(P)-dependent dehydrogenase (short-subunit alcohol dehydrogenase family)